MSRAAETAAEPLTWRGWLAAERYGEGLTARTPLEGWSMGKSLTATLLGILIKQGVYELSQPAPIPEWQTPGDPRAEIRIADILHMSSGLRIKAPQDLDYDPSGPYPDHLYLYTGSVDSFHYAATRPLQWPPNTVGRYHNTDPVLINYLIQLGVEKRGEEYLSFPHRKPISARSTAASSGSTVTVGFRCRGAHITWQVRRPDYADHPIA